MEEKGTTAEQTKTKTGVSRREFIAGTVGGLEVGAVAGAAVGSLGFPTVPASVSQPWLPAKWDYTADVVVVGTGHGGLSTAITAHDAGANVLVLEKMPQGLEGGNSRVSGNMLWAPLDATKGASYIKAMSQGQVQDETVFTTLANGLMENLTVITSLGGKPVVLSAAPSAAEWPELPGAETVQEYQMAPTTPTTYGPTYKVFRDAAASRNINIMYSTPATGLIQNWDTKEILGVTALTGGTPTSTGAPTGGTPINIRANKAVVLACGGFEFNPDMQRSYLPFWPFYGFGTPGNTGDGVEMAYKVGAELWHFNCPAGGSPGILLTSNPSCPLIRVDSGGIKNTVWVNKLGSRYVNENSATNHGWKIKEYSTMFSGYNGAFLAIPTWAIFDEAIRLQGPLTAATSGWNFYNSVLTSRGVAGHTWSQDNSVEIANGWITKAQTIQQLAAAIASDPDNENPMGQPFMDSTGAALQATITRYNGFCTAKTDSDFGRAASSLFPISTPPFYAMKIWPAGQNTQGGPKRDVNCHVLAPGDVPIPRLYSVGELGSFWGLMYNAGGNNGECLLTGRIAGKNAAAETPWS